MERSRIDIGRQRAASAKLALGVGAVVAFVVGIGLVRGTASGHAKAAPQPLRVPASFAQALRQQSSQPGVISPPQAPPQTSTTTS